MSVADAVLDPMVILSAFLCVVASLSVNLGLGYLKVAHFRITQTLEPSKHHKDALWWGATTIFAIGTSLHFIATRHIHMAAVIPIHAGGLIVGAKFAHDRLGETLAYLDRLGIAAVLIGLELTAAVSPSSVPQPAMPAVQLWDRVLNVMDPAPWFTACLVLSILAVFDLIRSHHSNSVVAATLPGAIAGAGYAACRPFIDFVRLTADGRSQLGCPMFFVTAIFAIIALAAFFRTLMSALGRYDNVILLPVLGVAVHTSVMLVDVFYLKLYPTLSAMQCVAFGTGVCVAMVGVGAVARHHLHGRVGSTPIPSPRLKVAGRIH